MNKMSKIQEKIIVGDLLKEKILKELVEPSYFIDVNETIKGRKCWRISGHVFESLSKILLAASGVISFAAGVYDDKLLSFVAGTLSTVSLATFQFSLYSLRMHKKNSLELNQLLDKLNIDTLPIFEVTKATNETLQNEIDTFTQQESYIMFAKEDNQLQKIETQIQTENDVYIIQDVYKNKDRDESSTHDISLNKNEEDEKTNLIENNDKI
jgi:hypothetical protein